MNIVHTNKQNKIFTITLNIQETPGYKQEEIVKTNNVN